LKSALTTACTIKLRNFEGPFDLLFHLIEENKFNIYDIPINEITDQYMEYLFAMKELDLEIASEFLVMASILLHIKSKLLLPGKKNEEEHEVDPRAELVTKLVEYKKYKDFSEELKLREQKWELVHYKLPEAIEFDVEEEVLELSPEELRRVFRDLLERNERKINKNNEKNMSQILMREKVSIKSKIREIAGILMKRTFFRFSRMFSLRERSKTEVVTGFLAILELAKRKSVSLKQEKLFSDIIVSRKGNGSELTKALINSMDSEIEDAYEENVLYPEAFNKARDKN
jgi:segregation and condensation protein A